MAESGEGLNPVRRVADVAKALADTFDAFAADDPPLKDGRPDVERIITLTTDLDEAWNEYSSSKGLFFDL